MTQTIPISKTKIIPPRRRSELLTRKRLVDVLNDGLDKKLTLISAPAGYGKTSLLIDLIDQSEFTCCWLALDELDIEPQRFFAYFISAISEQFPQFGGQSKSELDAMSSLEDDMEKLVVKISNEIFASIPEHFVFIIDDFHLVEGVQPIRNFIERFIRLMGENCHLFISSRKLIDLNETTLLTARNQLIGLSYDELAFLPEELQALLSQNKKLHITDKQAQELIDETEGWITGLQYSNADVLPKGSTGSAVNDGAAIYRYFESQVLGRQSQEMRDFIVRTAMFDEFDAKLCASVLEY